jgi:hypothetical protein
LGSFFIQPIQNAKGAKQANGQEPSGWNGQYRPLLLKED